MKIRAFFDSATSTVTYLVTDESTKTCAIIDSVLDYDQFSGKISHKSADNLINFINENQLKLEWILETHIHADHMTAASYLREKFNHKPKIAIGEGITEVLKYWAKAFNIENDVKLDGSEFDHIFKDGEAFKIGNLNVKFLTTHGHTPACGSYYFGLEENKNHGDSSDLPAVFVGDLMFMPGLGTGRADFPGGDASHQFDSLQKIFSLPENTKIFTGHDYPKEGEKPYSQSTVKDEKEQNIFAKITNKEEYVTARENRDKNLAVPKLLYPAIQINIRCGRMPTAESNKNSYIKIPLYQNS